MILPVRALATTASVAAAALLLSGCNFRGAASLPLPGGVGSNGYKVKVEFADALDLVPQSAVKVNDVTVGQVKSIEVGPKFKSALGVDTFTALVTVAVKRDVKLPENVDVRLRQTSLLGEKFVSFEQPAIPEGTLRDGAYIHYNPARTTANADIEQVLGALSLVLNGGSLEQLNTINTELTKALKGRESQVRDFLTQLTGFVTGLDAQKGQISNALDGLDRLSGKLAAERTTLDVALRDLPQGAQVLADERAQLTKVLQALSNLGTVATRVIQGTQQNTIADLRALQPILSQLAAAGKDLPNALELLTTYPFPRTVALPNGKGGIRGDYANLFVTLDGNPATLLNNLLGTLPLPVPLPVPKVGTKVAPKAPTLPSVPGLTDKGGLLDTPTGLSHLLLGGLS
ncbi:MAG: mammalian cell entry protein [Frankiales bacterium]|nr:mammalian cell entry protein [Frankiales bacterium]